MEGKGRPWDAAGLCTRWCGEALRPFESLCGSKGGESVGQQPSPSRSRDPTSDRTTSPRKDTAASDPPSTNLPGSQAESRHVIIMLFRLTLLCLAAAAFVAAAEPKSYTLFHRVYSPASPSASSSWSTRGSIEVGFDGPFATTAELRSAEKLSTFIESHTSQKDIDSLYQLALIPGSQEASTLPNSVSGFPGQVVAVRAVSRLCECLRRSGMTTLIRSLPTPQCLLDALIPGSYSFDVLGLTLSSNSTKAFVHSFNYDVVGITKGVDGCPRLPIPRKGGSAGSKEVVTKVSLVAPEEVEAPRLRTPPRPRADGATGAEPPPKEKSFLEKYWYCECMQRLRDVDRTQTNHPDPPLDQTFCRSWCCWHYPLMGLVEEKQLPLLLELGESDRVNEIQGGE